MREYFADGLAPSSTCRDQPRQQNRSLGWESRRANPRRNRIRKAPLPQARCQTCGEPVTGRYCDHCRPDAFVKAGRRSAAIRLESGQSITARNKRGAVMSHHRRANLDWEQEQNVPDAEVFRSKMLPGLKSVSLGEMAEATGST